MFWIVSVLAFGFIKLSVLFFYRRLFVKGTSTKFDVITKVAIGITLAWTIAFFLLTLFRCGRYINSQWGPLVDISRCLNGYNYTDALFVSDLITDLLVICLPIPIVSSQPCYGTRPSLADYLQILRLRMTTQRKLGVIGVLLLGTMCVAKDLSDICRSS